MPGLPWFLMKGAFKMTAKGAAVTFSSTVFSCTLACYIEIGAHRMLYHYFPEKYANVEYANGLTQEQLDAVRVYKIEYHPAEERNFVEEKSNIEHHHHDQQDLVVEEDNSKVVTNLRPFSRDGFWKEEKQRTPETSPLLTLTQIALPPNDIMACAMTG